MKRYLVVAIALWAGMGVAYGGRADFPSPTWSVRACPAGADAPKKNWNGISPQVKAWELGGRAKTLRWFEENQFGRTPVGRLPDQVIGASSVSFTNAGIRIAITCRLPAGADAAHPVPVFLFGDHCGGDRPPAYEQKEYADIPTNAITARGYAYVRWNFNDVCPNASRWSKTLFRWPVGIVSHVATGDRAATNVVRAADGWGTIGAWAWGNSRVMDWIESRPELDATRVAVLGHSRGGKTALWTGAQDERFAITISNGSGCGGARLGRARDPKAETIRQILHNFPNWFCPNFAAWIDRDAELPHDADDLIRLIAPRLVYVASGSEDAWAGPAAEKAAWDAAHDLYRAYGLEERMGYHCHEGPHKLRPDDWEKFMDFADRHLKAPSTADSNEIDRFNQDGVDVRKGCHNLVIENISGVTGDDAVALTASSPITPGSSTSSRPPRRRKVAEARRAPLGGGVADRLHGVEERGDDAAAGGAEARGVLVAAFDEDGSGAERRRDFRVVEGVADEEEGGRMGGGELREKVAASGELGGAVEVVDAVDGLEESLHVCGGGVAQEKVLAEGAEDGLAHAVRAGVGERGAGVGADVLGFGVEVGVELHADAVPLGVGIHADEGIEGAHGEAEMRAVEGAGDGGKTARGEHAVERVHARIDVVEQRAVPVPDEDAVVHVRVRVWWWVGVCALRLRRPTAARRGRGWRTRRGRHRPSRGGRRIGRAWCRLS